MKRAIFAAVAVCVVGSVVGVVIGAGGCTLLLPTDQLIKACTSNADCDKGFVCQENACLPEDQTDGEGEGAT